MSGPRERTWERQGRNNNGQQQRQQQGNGRGHDADTEALAAVKEYLFANRARIAACIPSAWGDVVDAPAVVAYTMAAIENEPLKRGQGYKLRYCGYQSILTAVCVALRVGLLPGSDQAFLIAYNGVCTLQVGYKGWVEIIARSGLYHDVRTELVHKDDVFEWSPTSMGPPVHRYGPKRAESSYNNLSDFTWAYCVIPRKDGGPPVVEVTTVRDVMRFKQSTGAWKDSPREMARKFILKRAAKYLPKTAETMEIIRLDNLADRAGAIDAQVTHDTGDYLAAQTMALPPPIDIPVPDAGAELERRRAEMAEDFRADAAQVEPQAHEEPPPPDYP